MGLNTTLGSSSKEDRLRNDVDVHNDNSRLFGLVAAGSAAISVCFGAKYGADSAGAIVFAVGTFFGGGLSVVEKMDSVDASRELTSLANED